MKLTHITVIPLAMVAIASTAQAQDSDQDKPKDSGAYGALGVSASDFDNYGLDAKLGYNFSKHFGVEAEGTLGLSSESRRLSSSAQSATLTAKREYTFGAFAVARLPLTEQFEVFARSGVQTTRFNIDINNALDTSYNVERTGLAVGGGAQFKLDAKNALRADYTYFEKIDLGTASIAYVRKF